MAEFRLSLRTRRGGVAGRVRRPRSTLLKEAVAALAADRGVRAVAEVVEYEGAVAAFGVAEGDHLAQLALFECGAARDVFGPDAKTRRRLFVEHHDSARASRGAVADESSFGERGERALECGEFRAE